MIKKRKVVIVGAGNVGASTAFCMINQGICDEIVLIDMNTERAKGETLDNVKLELEKIKNQYPLKPLVVIMNKKDLLSETEIQNIQNQIPNILLISAKNNIWINFIFN